MTRRDCTHFIARYRLMHIALPPWRDCAVFAQFNIHFVYGPESFDGGAGWYQRWRERLSCEQRMTERNVVWRAVRVERFVESFVAQHVPTAILRRVQVRED